MLDAPLPLDERGALQPPALSLSPEAFEVWRQLHDDIEREIGRRGEFADLPDFGAKAAEQAARFACILHIFERGPGGEIGQDMMLAAARIAVWHLHETRRVLTMIGHAGEAADAQALLDWLHDRADAPTLGDILRLGPYRLRDRARRDPAVSKLIEHGLARIEKRGDAEHMVLTPRERA